jgi:hypothetical protein
MANAAGTEHLLAKQGLETLGEDFIANYGNSATKLDLSWNNIKYVVALPNLLCLCSGVL